MIYYAAMSCLIAFLGICKKTSVKKIKWINISIIIFLILFAGLRGDFTSDYNNYKKIYIEVSESTWREIFSFHFGQEIGFICLTKILAIVFHSHVIYFTVLSTLTILFLYIGLKDSVEHRYIWLSLLLFVGIGGYYDSFNVTRQLLSASIVFLGAKFLYNRNLIRYIIVIFFASLFHVTALIMMPLYFLLNIDLNKKNIICMSICMVGIIACLPLLIEIVQTIFPKYAHYTYGMSGGSWKFIVIPLAVFILVVFNLYVLPHNEFNLKNNRNRIQINATIYCLFFSILTTQVFMLGRLVYFVQPFSYALLGNLCTLYKNKSDKQIVLFVLICICILYPIVIFSDTGYDPYYFFWETK